MAKNNDADILQKTKHIILFFSESCGHCIDFKKQRWPELAGTAQSCNILVSEVNVQKPDPLMKYHKINGVPNTVFLGKDAKILKSNPGNFDTSNLVNALKSSIPEIGYAVEYRDGSD